MQSVSSRIPFVIIRQLCSTFILCALDMLHYAVSISVFFFLKIRVASWQNSQKLQLHCNTRLRFATIDFSESETRMESTLV